MIRRIANLFRKIKEGRPVVGATPADVIHRENKWRILRYRPDPEATPLETEPILLVPSLINRHYVLDLMPGKSFVEFLVGRGHDVYIIDWGTPGDEDRYLTFDDFCYTYLGRAIRKVAARSPTGKTHVLGYCLGGTLTTIYAALDSSRIASMITLAAPVDFHDEGLLSTWSRLPSLDLDALVDGTGNIPWQLMQTGFHLLRPTMNLSKAVYMLDRAWDDRFLDGFFAIETWSNDNVRFPGEAFRRYIKELYQRNLLVKEKFTVAGRVVRLSEISCPTLAVSFSHDNIVPAQSVEALLDHIDPDMGEVLELRGGHVGAVVSSRASTSLWPKLSDWFIGEDATLLETSKLETSKLENTPESKKNTSKRKTAAVEQAS